MVIVMWHVRVMMVIVVACEGDDGDCGGSDGDEEM